MTNHTRVARLWLASVAPLAPLAGCTVGPTYTPPTPRVADSFRSLGDTPEGAPPLVAVAETPGDLSTWWTLFRDPTLDGLIARAATNNHDLRLAGERLAEARALRGVAESRRLPDVNAGAGATLRQQSSTIGQGEQNPRTLWDASLDASWELDLFGGVRRGVEAARADLEAAEEERRDVLVTLTAEVARTYAEYRGTQQRLALASRTIAAARDTLELTRSRTRAGIAAEIETEQARAQLATRESQVPPLRVLQRQAAFRLAVLLGESPDALLDELGFEGPELSPPSRLATGVPAETLRRRPDVRRAERELAAATARIGVATADLYPRVFLAGDAGLSAEKLASLPDNSSRSWGLGPSLRWNLFSGGRVRANIEAASSRARQALLRHDRAVLLALEDCESALTRFAHEQDRLRHLTEAVDADRRAVDLATDRHAGGIGDFLTVLVNQRELYDAEDALIQSRTALVTSTIATFKALGGGWPLDPAP